MPNLNFAEALEISNTERTMAHKFINQIEPGESIDDIYIIRDPILRSTTRGDLYIAMFLLDRSGSIERTDVAGNRNNL